MAISGTVPFFDTSVSPHLESPNVVTVTGTAAQGEPTGTYSTEGYAAFLSRVIDATSVSGILSGTAQAITPSELSGILHIQRECAFRLADLKLGPAAGQAARLARAQSIIAAASGATVPGAGETKFGS